MKHLLVNYLKMRLWIYLSNNYNLKKLIIEESINDYFEDRDKNISIFNKNILRENMLI